MKSEGGYVNDPDDAGGETNFGVTKSAWSEYVGRPIYAGEMRALTLDKVKQFYKTKYWDAVKGDQLPAGVDYLVFDFSVNAGITQASKFLQRCVKAEQDGKIGGHTLTLVNAEDPQIIVLRFSTLKELFYRGLAAKNPNQTKFLKGWLNRVQGVDAAAKDLIAAANPAGFGQSYLNQPKS